MISCQQLEEILFFWQVATNPSTAYGDILYWNFFVNYWDGSNDSLQIASNNFPRGTSDVNILSLNNVEMGDLKDLRVENSFPKPNAKIALSRIFVIGTLNSGEYLFIAGFPQANGLWLIDNTFGLENQYRVLQRDPSCCPKYLNQTQYLQFWILIGTEDYQSSSPSNPITTLMINGMQIPFSLDVNQAMIGQVLFVEITNTSMIPVTEYLQIEIQTSATDYWTIQSIFMFGLVSDGFTPPSWNVITANNFTNSPIQITLNNSLILNVTKAISWCENCVSQLSDELCLNCINDIAINNSICFPQLSQPPNSILTSKLEKFYECILIL